MQRVCVHVCVCVCVCVCVSPDLAHELHAYTSAHTHTHSLSHTHNTHHQTAPEMQDVCMRVCVCVCKFIHELCAYTCTCAHTPFLPRTHKPRYSTAPDTQGVCVYHPRTRRVCACVSRKAGCVCVSPTNSARTHMCTHIHPLSLTHTKLTVRRCVGRLRTRQRILCAHLCVCVGGGGVAKHSRLPRIFELLLPCTSAYASMHTQRKK